MPRDRSREVWSHGPDLKELCEQGSDLYTGTQGHARVYRGALTWRLSENGDRIPSSTRSERRCNSYGLHLKASPGTSCVPCEESGDQRTPRKQPLEATIAGSDAMGTRLARPGIERVATRRALRIVSVDGDTHSIRARVALPSKGPRPAEARERSTRSRSAAYATPAIGNSFSARRPKRSPRSGEPIPRYGSGL